MNARREQQQRRVVCTQLSSMMVYQKLEAVPKATTIVFTFTAMTLLPNVFVLLHAVEVGCRCVECMSHTRTHTHSVHAHLCEREFNSQLSV